ncbi:MAG: DUF3048 domain-containing protein [Clostridia bacterium]|nr:DUF3048 domain-containing protein [Clostridia bacterium]
MLKKAAVILLSICLVFAIISGASAAKLANQKDRNVKIKLNATKGNYPVNPVIPGESPTTGLPWEGVYRPMLVQIDNNGGGVGSHAPWGASEADIIYEMPLTSAGYTRLTFLFSDIIAESAGPIRSARLGHVWLREEWNAGFIFYGGPASEEVSILNEFSKLGATKKGVLFNGTDGENKPWKAHFSRVGGKAAPSNVDANVAAIQGLIPAEHTAPDRPFLFTDELPSKGKKALSVTLNWPNAEYSSKFFYDEYSCQYFRSNVKDVPYTDDKTYEQIAFANVIVQRVKVSYAAGGAQPNVQCVGKGNADIFIGGMYIAGYWTRTGMDQRTIFFDDKGNELKLLRGKTFISMMPVSYTVEYQ